MDAFREIYDRYYQDVRRFALFLTGDSARADDLAADTFVRAWQARDRIRHATVKAYLFTIARNLYRDQLRSSRAILARQVELEDTLADAAPGVDLHVQHVSALKDVKLRLRRVARGDRRALLLYVVKEMSYAEVAVALGISVGAVKSRICRARDALSAPLRPVENGEGR
jgi:RNA polymerase sigma-70 factor (ECF subfamily)